MQRYDVIIIGAGAAGLTACNQLLKLGVKNVLIVEAQNYVGGRIKTFHEWGRPIELGAEFIHGDQVVTAQMAHELNLEAVNAYEDRKLIDASGTPLSHEQRQTYQELFDYVLTHGRPGVSVAEIIESNPITKDLTLRQLVHLFVTDLECGDSDKLDSAAFGNGIKYTKFKGNNLMLKDGYQQIVSYLAKDLPIRLDTPVKKVDYTNPEIISLTLDDGELLMAKKVIITVSLGVLQHQAIEFNPALPAAKKSIINKLGMGQAMKFIVRLKDPHEVKDLYHYADGESGSLQTITCWWASATDPRVLVGECGGSRAIEVLSMPEKRLVEKVLGDLSKILQKDISEDLVDYKIARWDDNPYTFGAYSYHPVGVQNKDRIELAKPIDNRIFWAGEATVSDGNYAMVHGAISSGYRVAAEVTGSAIIK